MSSNLVLFYSNLLQELKNFDSQETEDEDRLEENLNKFRFEKCEQNLNKFFSDLNSPDLTLESRSIICESIAELAKDEKSRDLFIDSGLFVPLTCLLANTNSSLNLKIQLCRSIGNLCYENNKGREKFLESGGLDNLVDLFKTCSKFKLNQDRKLEIKLLQVSLGCLHNVTNDNETIKKRAYELSIFEVLNEYVGFLNQDMGILIHFGSLIENLLELDQGKEYFVKNKLASSLYKLMDEDFLNQNEDYIEDLLRILNQINELENSKNFLCESEFMTNLISFAEQNLNNEDLLRNFGGFLTNLLCSDDKIDLIFEYKSGLIISKAIEWLESENEQLILASAVIIANYMRSDEKALKMVQHPNKPHLFLLNNLNKYSKFSTNSTLQQINLSHSLLSTFKNFCISPQSRENILKINPIETIVKFLDFNNLEVKWKALSIIRLLVKNCTESTGLALIFSEEVLKKIEIISHNTEEHPGVAGESSRLVCYLPIAAKSEKNIKKMLNFNFIPIIVKQLKSEHVIMLNEALLAINVLIAVDYKTCFDAFKNSDLNENLLNMFKKENLPIELKANGLKIIKYFLDMNDFYTPEQLTQILDRLKTVKLSTQESSLKSFIEQLINLVENLNL